MQLHERFIETALLHRGKVAFIDRYANKQLSYYKILIASLIFADKLKAFKDTFIGIMMPTSAGSAISILGTLMANKVPVMINYSTGALHNVKYSQDKCGFKTVLTSKALLQKINCPENTEGFVFVEDIASAISLKDKLKAFVKSNLPLNVLKKIAYCDGDDDKTAVILFTSGSEKDPKAVELSHQNIISNIEGFSAVAKLTANDVMLANLPYFHVFGLTVNLWTPIYHGMTVISYANPLDFQSICEIIRQDKPTVMAGTPSFWWGYLKKSQAGDFASLRLLISGADKCPQALRDGFWHKHSKVLLEGYGCTETSPVISVNMPEHNKPGSIGKPLPNVQVLIEDYETGSPCPINKQGRILVKGPNVMKGYFGDVEETAMRIRHGWYDTGDIGYLDEDGYLWHLGRLKRFVKVGGEMVSLVKVEDVLASLLPEDVGCCVVDVPDELKGSKIVAVLTSKDSSRLNERQILKGMSEQLPNIALPKQFVYLQELPKMGSGKIDFRKVSQIVKEILDA